MLFLGGRALGERGLRAASRISAATGVRLLAETFPARMERGAGVPVVDRLAYLAEQAEVQLAGLDHLILAGARAPVSFFAYPGRASDLVPAGCTVTVLADRDQDVEAALEELADQVAAGVSPVVAEAVPPQASLGRPSRVRSTRSAWPTRSPHRCPSRPSSSTRRTPRASRCPRRWPARRGTPC